MPVSEYQYYEFQALDRPLTEAEQREVRQLSTRAEITATSFTNEYHFGSFRGKPLDMVKHWYDAHLYFANWGTHRLMLRVPRSLVDVEAIEPYCDGECLSLDLTPNHAILEFNANTEGGLDWDEIECRLAPLIPIRDSLMAGDPRCLYLGWLCAAQEGHLQDDDEEPPVPPGLDRLTGSLRSLADFLWLDDDLLQLAAEGSTGTAPADVTEDDVAAWVAGQPETVKNLRLLRLVRGEAAHLRSELWQQARCERKTAKAAPAAVTSPRRTVRQLLDAWETRREEEERRRQEERLKAQAAAERKRAAERAKHLDALAAREAETWRRVEELIQTKLPKNYDEAVGLLRDLWELAERDKRRDQATARVRELRQRHARKPSLIARLDRAGLAR